MSIVTKVAKMRLNYHATMLDICNVANQLGILKDEKAEDAIIPKEESRINYDEEES